MKTNLAILGILAISVCSGAAATKPTASETRLRSLVEEIAVPQRHWGDTAALNAVARGIRTHFERLGLRCQEQPFEVEGRTYRNVECVLPGRSSESIVVGAHYDVAGQNPGADDNASGVAGLIELARTFKESGNTPRSTLRFVAFTLEEPPFYNTESMGSFQHARRMKDSGIVLKQMISLEMIGYYGESHLQSYPPGLDATNLPKRGNFYAAISDLSSAELTRSFKAAADKLKIVNTIAYSAAEGVEWSDHMNYWKFGFPAFMITDTAFLRNRNYHRKSDTPDTLNYKAMAGLLLTLHAYLKDA